MPDWIIIAAAAVFAVWIAVLFIIWNDGRKAKLVKITTEAPPVKPFPWDFN